MKQNKFKEKAGGIFLALAVILYIVGVLFIPDTDLAPLKTMEVAEQDEYRYFDSEGEEREGLSLIRIEGLGKIMTYQDVYRLSVPIFLLAMVLGIMILGREEDEIEYIIFANCIIGTILIMMSTKQHILSDVFFWSGIVSAKLAVSYDRESKKK